MVLKPWYAYHWWYFGSLWWYTAELILKMLKFWLELCLFSDLKVKFQFYYFTAQFV